MVANVLRSHIFNISIVGQCAEMGPCMGMYIYDVTF
ncbi:hypothetical protein SAMN04488696_2499, partial [Methanolobus profundi]